MATMVKIKADVRMRINDALHDMCRIRHQSIPLSDITSLLERYGMKIEECILTGRSGNAQIDVLTMDGQEVNSWLVLSWLKGDHDGQWEVNAYLS